MTSNSTEITDLVELERAEKLLNNAAQQVQEKYTKILQKKSEILDELGEVEKQEKATERELHQLKKKAFKLNKKIKDRDRKKVIVPAMPNFKVQDILSAEKAAELTNQIPYLGCYVIEYFQKDKNEPIFELIAPTREESLECFKEYIAGQIVSTYPYIVQQPGANPERMAEPICDQFHIRRDINQVIVALADGCNWGTRPATAAKQASNKFVEHMSSVMKYIDDTNCAAVAILKAFALAQSEILKGYESNIFDCGTTTMLGGVLLEIDRESYNEPDFGFVCANVGDCKAFMYIKKEERFIDITAGNRPDLLDASDPGGRLGPYIGDGEPDTRNFGVYFQPCEEGDIIFIVSDGVHDNLDPQTLAQKPAICGLNFETWEEATNSDPIAVSNAKDQFRTDLISKIVGIQNISCAEITAKLINYCVRLTKSSRDFMENNPQSRLPDNYVEFPGKLDHTSCVAFLVSNVHKGHIADAKKLAEQLKVVQKSGNARATVSSSDRQKNLEEAQQRNKNISIVKSD